MIDDGLLADQPDPHIPVSSRSQSWAYIVSLLLEILTLVCAYLIISAHNDRH
jgi:hypothetical protein